MSVEASPPAGGGDPVAIPAVMAGFSLRPPPPGRNPLPRGDFSRHCAGARRPLETAPMNRASAVSAPPTPAVRTLSLADEAATRRLAEALAARSRPRDVIALHGPLGAGKTAFARSFILALARRHGAPAPAEVPSPTFTLVQTYALGPVSVWHFDLYRLSAAEEAVEIGLDEALAEGICLIEWPDRLGRFLPAERLDLALAYDLPRGPAARAATLTGHGAWADRIADVA